MPDNTETNRKLRERDFYDWSRKTEMLLSQRRLDEIDWDAVAAELERSAEVNDVTPMKAAVERLLTHLAIWNLSPNYHTSQRRTQIESARFKLEDLLVRSPSLVEALNAQWKDLYMRARFAAMLIIADPRVASEAPAMTLAELLRAESEAELESTSATRRSLGCVSDGARQPHSADDDHYAWCRAQAAAAHARQFCDLDPFGIAEEISDVAASVRGSAIEALARLLEDLIAWQRGIRNQMLRRKIASHRSLARAILWRNPSLARVPELVTEAYRCLAREREWGVFNPGEPRTCPWTMSELLDDAFPFE